MSIVLFKYLNSEPFRFLAKSLSLKIIDTVPRDLLTVVDDENPDIVLAPVTYIQELESRDYKLSNIVIASKGPVKSVCVLAEDRRINNFDIIYATRESVVSVKVLEHILKIRNVRPKIVHINVTLENIKEVVKRGPLLAIGDIALIARKFYRPILDLAQEWYKLYSKPLVFAVVMYRSRDHVSRIIRAFYTMLSSKKFLRNVAKLTSHWIVKYLRRDEIFQYFVGNLMYVLDNASKYVTFQFSRLLSNF